LVPLWEAELVLVTTPKRQGRENRKARTNLGETSVGTEVDED